VSLALHLKEHAELGVRRSAPPITYVSTSWFWPCVINVGAGAAVATGSIKIVPIYLPSPVKVDQLAAHVTTVAASGNFKLAIYANNPATNRPTGTPLIQSNAAGSTASAGPIATAAASAVTLPAGLLWAALQVDATAGGTAAFKTVVAAAAYTAALVGSTTIGNASSASAVSAINLAVAQAYGTFPDMTAASFTEEVAFACATPLLRAA